EQMELGGRKSTFGPHEELDPFVGALEFEVRGRLAFKIPKELSALRQEGVFQVNRRFYTRGERRVGLPCRGSRDLLPTFELCSEFAWVDLDDRALGQDGVDGRNPKFSGLFD